MDRNNATQAAVSAASSLATKFRRTLLVVHARSSAEASAFLNPEATTLEEFGVKATAESPVRCLIKDGHPADALTRAIEQYRPAMLVVGVKRKSETPGPHGTVFALLAASRVPVLCVPTAPIAKVSTSLPQVSAQTA
jgi:nucleotide-binding universal stress UspA family protein